MSIYLKAKECDIGDRIKILNSGEGALGADDKTGVIVAYSVVNTEGLGPGKPGIKVKLDGSSSVWKISKEADVKILQKN